MAMKKRRVVHKRGSHQIKGKKRSKRKVHRNVHSNIQDQNCKEDYKNNIYENKSKHENTKTSRISKALQSITQIQEENVISARCNLKNEYCCEHVLLKDSKEYVSKSESLQSSEMKEESADILFTNVKIPEVARCKLLNDRFDKYENVKMLSLSSSDIDQLSKSKRFSEQKLQSKNTKTSANDYKRNSVDLKDDTNQCSNPFSKHNDNKQKEICNKKIENELMNEVLSYRNIRINSEAINIYIVDNIPRHPPRLGDIPWSWLNEEKWRLHTFSRYPYDAPKSAILLAAEGFSYIGTGRDSDDSVICYFCETIKKKWHPLDDIPQIHEQLSPCCSFVKKINCTNVPLKTSFDDSLFCQLFKPIVNNKRGQNIQKNGTPSANNFKAPERNIESFISSPAIDTSGIVRNGSAPIETDGASPPLDSVGIGRNETPQISVSDTYVASQAAINPNFTQISRERTSSSSLQNSEITATQAPAPSLSLHADSILSHSATPSPQSSVTTGQSSAAAGQSLNTATTVPTTTTQTVTVANQNAVKSNAGGPTYSELGIVTERPKRFEYALLAKRMETFLSWPRDHHLRPKELAEAGFYYAGYGDCARCFYCGGGLRNWEDEDDVWVEHARWFPKCAYIRQQMGQVFVDTVQELNKTNDRIFFSMVTDQIGHAASAFQLDSKDNPLKRDPAVKTILDMGYPLAEVIAVAETIKEDGNILSSDKIYEKLVAAKIKKNPNTKNIIQTGTGGSEASHTDDIETMRTLKEKNNQLRQQTTCKICMDKEVAVVFLPCGHFVSCTDCAAAMKDCPVCRNHVKGIVRAFMG